MDEIMDADADADFNRRCGRGILRTCLQAMTLLMMMKIEAEDEGGDGDGDDNRR